MKNNRCIFFDAETTGVNVKTAKITELFGVELVGDIPTGKLFYHLLDPAAYLEKIVEEKTGLNNEFLLGRLTNTHGYPRFATFLGDGDASKAKDVALGGHNVDRYDIEILNRRHKEHYGHQLRDDAYLAEAKRRGLKNYSERSTVDTMTLIYEENAFFQPGDHDTHPRKSKYPSLVEAGGYCGVNMNGIPQHCAAGDVPISLGIYYHHKYGPYDSHSDDENVFRKKLVKFLYEQAKSVSEPFFRYGAKEPLGYNRDNGSGVYTVSPKACLDKDIADALADLSKYSNWRGRALYTRKILHQVKMLREDAGKVSGRQLVPPLISREKTPEDTYGLILPSDEKAFVALAEEIETVRQDTPELVSSDARHAKSPLISREKTPEDTYGLILPSDEKAFVALAEEIETVRQDTPELVSSDARHAKSPLISREKTPEDTYGLILPSDEKAFVALAEEIETVRQDTPELVSSDARHAKSPLGGREKTPDDAYGSITLSDEAAFSVLAEEIETVRQDTPELVSSDARHAKSPLGGREKTPDDAYGSITLSDEAAFSVLAEQAKKSRQDAPKLISSNAPRKRILSGETEANAKRPKVAMGVPHTQNRERDNRGL